MQKSSWRTVIGLVMAVVGGASVYFVINDGLNRNVSILQIAFTLLTPLIIGLAGAGHVISNYLFQPENSQSSNYSLDLEPYALAWRRFWSTIWLKKIYLLIAVISGAGVAVSSFINYLIATNLMRTYNIPQQNEDGAVTYNWLIKIVGPVYQSIRGNVLHVFQFNLGSSNWERVMIVAGVIGLIWGFPRLLKLRNEPEYSSKISFYCVWIVLLCIGCGFSSYFYFSEAGEYLKLTGQNASGFAGLVELVKQDAEAVVRYKYPQMGMQVISGLAIPTLVSAILIGGILGSLVRSKKDEGVTADTFLADSVRNFEPLAAYYLVVGLIGNYFVFLKRPPSILSLIMGLLSLAALLLIFVPLGVAVRRMSFFESVRQSIGLWKSKWLQILLLIAPGVFFYVIYRAVVLSASMMFSKGSILHVVLTPAFAVIWVIVQAVLLLAVWEFYCRERWSELRAEG